jgi:hypothetical protein
MMSKFQIIYLISKASQIKERKIVLKQVINRCRIIPDSNNLSLNRCVRVNILKMAIDEQTSRQTHACVQQARTKMCVIVIIIHG